jgi:hypothetical protein
MNVLKKGLISLAAASILVTGASATSVVQNTVTAKTHYSGVTRANFDTGYYFTMPDINISEQIAGQIAGIQTLSIKIPKTVALAVTESNASGAGSETLVDINVSSISGSNVYVEGNTTTSTILPYLTFDYNSTKKYRLMPLGYELSNEDNRSIAVFSSTDDNANRVALVNSNTGKLIDLNATGQTTSNDGTSVTAISDTNMTTVGTIDTTNADYVIFNVAINNDSVSGNDSGKSTILLENIKIAPKTTTQTGDVNIVVESSEDISTHTVKVGSFTTSPVSLVLNTTTVPNLSPDTATAQDFADFNVSLVDNLEDADGNITLEINTGSWYSAGTSNLTITNSSAKQYTDENNRTVEFDLNDDKLTLGLEGNITTTGVSAGTSITVNFKENGSDGNFSSIAPLATPLTIANVVTDGVQVALAGTKEGSSTSATATTTAVVPGRTYQVGLDVNVSELFATTFEAGETISLSLPTGYVWATKPTVTTQSDANQTTVQADGSNVYTVTFTETDTEGTFKTYTSDDLKETLNITGIKFNVPSSAVSDTPVSLTVSGTNLTNKTGDSTSIDIATVKSSSATISQTFDETSSDVKIGLNSSVSDGKVFFTVEESYAGNLELGKTISITLDKGSFTDTVTAPLAVSATNSKTTSSAITLGSAVYSGDSNQTATFTITDISTANEQNLTLALGDITFANASATAGIVNASIAGTAGVTGTIKVANLVEGNTKTDGTLVALPVSSIDEYTAEMTLNESLTTGLTDSGTFNIYAPKGVIFTGYYAESTKTSTAATYSAYAVKGGDSNVSTTFNTKDTLNVQIPALAGTSSVKFKFKVNVLPDATDGLKTFTIKNVNSGIIATSTNLLYVGTIPTLTAASNASVEAGATTSAVPTNATGTITYVSSDTTVATVAADGTVTVASDATAGATATITATDALTAQAASMTVTVAETAVTEDALVTALKATGSYDITGKYANQDMNADGDKTDASDWTFTFVSNNATYQLLGADASDANPFGWASTTETPATASYYMVNLGDWDADGNTRYDWIVVSTSGAVYKLKGANATTNSFEYETNTDGSVKAYDVTATIDTTANTISFE